MRIEGKNDANRSIGPLSVEATMHRCLLYALLPLTAALVPFASIDCMRPWLETSTHKVVGHEGLLKPRLGTDADPVTLGLMEADDVACVSSLIADAFGGGIEVIDNGGQSWEDKALRGVADVVKTYDSTEYALGLRARCGARLKKPARLTDPNDRGAVMLIAARPSGSECVAAVELRLRRADGAHPTPLPMLDALRDAFSAKSSAPDRPYISNVCVADACRRRGVAQALMDAAEHLAGPSGWGYDSVFLHVHEENPAALGLYEALAYEKLDALDEAPLRYFYKRLSEYAPSSSEVVAAAGR